MARSYSADEIQKMKEFIKQHPIVEPWTNWTGEDICDIGAIPFEMVRAILMRDSLREIGEWDD